MKKDEKKKTFKELWADTRTRAIIKLGMWFGFFAILFIVSSIASLFNKNTNYKNAEVEQKEEEKVEMNVPSLLRKIKTSDYSYEYTITNAEVTIHYNGTNEDNINKGYYESNEGIVKYELKEGIYYKVENDVTTEEQIAINDTDKNIMDINNLIKRIYDYEDAGKNPEVTENIYRYDFSNEQEKYVVNITISGSSISKIEIDYNDIKYNLEYKTIVK